VDTVEKAIAEKKIVRTWPMRGTLHFVSPEDVRWMLEFLTPRVFARSAGLYKQAGLDDAVFHKSWKVIEKVLKGGKKLTRQEVYEALEKAKISARNVRGLHILGNLAQRGLICFGPHRGKQPTFVLLEEWLPPVRKLKRDEALAELAARYFASHGPATLQDFSWWSGLTLSEAKKSVEMIRDKFDHRDAGNQTYWFSPAPVHRKKTFVSNFLLPPFDEYTVAYKDRSAAINSEFMDQARNGIFGPTLVIDGKIVGTWKREIKKEEIIIQTETFKPPGKGVNLKLAAAAEDYASFWKMPFRFG
jgi:hypothetical protein